MSKGLGVYEGFYIDGYAAAISDVQKTLEILKSTVGPAGDGFNDLLDITMRAIELCERCLNRELNKSIEKRLMLHWIEEDSK
jgi:hypothetical protein